MYNDGVASDIEDDIPNFSSKCNCDLSQKEKHESGMPWLEMCGE